MINRALQLLDKSTHEGGEHNIVKRRLCQCQFPQRELDTKQRRIRINFAAPRIPIGLVSLKAKIAISTRAHAKLRIE